MTRVYTALKMPAEATFSSLLSSADDILAAASSLHLIQRFEQDLKKVYTITSLGIPKRLVGLNIIHNSNGLTLDQTQFVKDVADQFKQTHSKPVSTPMVLGDVPSGASRLLPPGHKYLSLVGSLLWASLARPDIAVAVSITCTKSVQPTNKADVV